MWLSSLLVEAVPELYHVGGRTDYMRVYELFTDVIS
jgi:hypothetical protein